MDGIIITDRCEMFDMHGQVPDAYPPGHVYIIGGKKPEYSVLMYIVQAVTRRMPDHYYIAGKHSDLWEEKIREQTSDRLDVEIFNFKDSLQDLADEMVKWYLGQWQPRCYLYYDDRSKAEIFEEAVHQGIQNYRDQICEKLKRLGVFEFKYFGLDFVFSIGDDGDVLLGRIGHVEKCDNLDAALDIPAFSDWTMFRLWHKIEKQADHWLREMEK